MNIKMLRDMKKKIEHSGCTKAFPDDGINSATSQRQNFAPPHLSSFYSTHVDQNQLQHGGYYQLMTSHQTLPYPVHSYYEHYQGTQHMLSQSITKNTSQKQVNLGRAPLKTLNGYSAVPSSKGKPLVATRAYTGKRNRNRTSTSQPQRKRKKMYSDYIGVTFNKTHNKFQACITHYRKQHYLGRYKLAADAAKAYDDSARSLKGPDWKVNFITLSAYVQARSKEESLSGKEVTNPPSFLMKSVNAALGENAVHCNNEIDGNTIHDDKSPIEKVYENKSETNGIVIYEEESTVLSICQTTNDIDNNAIRENKSLVGSISADEVCSPVASNRHKTVVALTPGSAGAIEDAAKTLISLISYSG